MGRLVFGELETVREMAHEIEDIERWQDELDELGQRLRGTP